MEEQRRGRGDRSAAEEAIEHPLVSAVPEQPLGAFLGHYLSFIIIYRIHAIIVRSLHGDLRGCSVAAAPRGGAAAAQSKSLGRLRQLVDRQPGPIDSVASLIRVRVCHLLRAWDTLPARVWWPSPIYWRR